MARTWQVQRGRSPLGDGQRRWDQAYQHLLRWHEVAPREGKMRVALYARVSTTRQAQAQTIEQQLQRLQAHAREHEWTLAERQIFRDDGYSGASLQRPGLDALRDQAGVAEFEVVLVTAPDRLARKYVHQVLLIEELERCGCRVEFLDRPMSQDPHDQLLLQIRGAVAEYERTLIAERMRRGRLAKLRAGQLLPWAVPPYGFRTDPVRPRDPAGVRHDAYEALIVQQLFSWYLEPGTTLHRLVKRLRETAVPTPSGRGCWRGGTVRNILRNPAYAGQACGNRYRCIPAHQRSSALRPTGQGISHRLRPEDEWVTIAVPPLVSREEFDLVHAKLAQNQQTARRNNRSQQYLLRGLLNCGRCQLRCTGSTRNGKYHDYACRGHVDPLRAAQGQRCTTRYIPVGQLDAAVWQDLCAIVTDPAHLAAALARAQGGLWLPQELQARQATVQQTLDQLARQQHRLLDAYVAGVVELPELEREKRELTQRQSGLLVQLRQLHAQAAQHVERQTIADGLEAFCDQVRAGLTQATFDQQRLLVELLVDRVIVTDSVVEIRYAFPTTRDGPHRPFCQLRLDYRGGVPERVPDIRGSPRQSGAVHRRRLQHQALTLEPRLPAARRVRDAPPNEREKLTCPLVW